MESIPENMSSKITFKNQPKLYGQETDKKYDVRRLALVPEVENFISTDELFKDQEVSVEFSHKGVSSLVAFIEVADKKFVLKTPLSLTGYEAEGQFLKAWKEVGVSVPNIVQEGELGGRSYLLMDYIDAPTLTDAVSQGLIKEDTSFEMGKILRTMHTVKAEGYGSVCEGGPEYKTFKEWLLNHSMEKRIKTVLENNVLGDEHGSITKVFDTLIEFVERNPQSTYCHFDFGSSNILATKPLTVFDPDPLFNNGIIDIGRSMLLSVSGGHAQSAEKLKAGYFEGEDVDTKALQASIIFNAYWKGSNWFKKVKLRSIKNVQDYLLETRGLL